jgi:GNAT superfamily N-acetyltransferase
MLQSTVRVTTETVVAGVNPALDDAQFDLVQAYIARLFPAYRRRGLEFHVSTDFEEFVAIRRASADGFVYPTYDPAQSSIAPENGFWVKICNDAGDVVAGQATRVFDIPDFYQLLQSGRLWFDRSLASVPDFTVDCELPEFGGRVAHLGGLWVDEAYRGRKLATLICATTRVLTLRNYGFDHETGLCFESIALRRLPIESYGHPQLALCIDDYFPVSRRRERVYLSHLSRTQALQQIEAGWGLADPASAQKSVGVAA